ncbi:hypothetical protein VNO78_10154 [Psophocarpus tetragonolobus]|uniref:Uncharacterized protein n=1 Tax=Psophocarpus tetragonolobus TaxID=3891 RepID=A0AAN9XMH0_PSOTE
MYDITNYLIHPFCSRSLTKTCSELELMKRNNCEVVNGLLPVKHVEKSVTTLEISPQAQRLSVKALPLLK